MPSLLLRLPGNNYLNGMTCTLVRYDDAADRWKAS